MLSSAEQFSKRSFDMVFAAVGIVLTGWLMFLAWVVASVETRSNGLFVQKRIGREGKSFDVYKIRTMKAGKEKETSVTTSHDDRITKSGAFFRKTKIDELPQLFNVLLGNMSVVGPRPDVQGFADKLEGEERIILSVRPGITGPASLKYKGEEAILAEQEDPETYNAKVLWPDKVKINMDYVKHWSFTKDIGYIFKTFLG